MGIPEKRAYSYNFMSYNFVKKSRFLKDSVLFLNTVSIPHTMAIVEEKTQKIISWKQWKTADQREDTTLTVLKNMMKGKKWESLKAIIVVNGPGPFTRIRIGVSVANALSYMYHLPLYAVKNPDMPNLPQSTPLTCSRKSVFQKFLHTIHLEKMKEQAIVEPYYDRQPNITLSKKHPLS